MPTTMAQNTHASTSESLSTGLLKMLQAWRQLPDALAADAKRVLERARDRDGCSKNAGEIAGVALAE